MSEPLRQRVGLFREPNASSFDDRIEAGRFLTHLVLRLRSNLRTVRTTCVSGWERRHPCPLTLMTQIPSVTGVYRKMCISSRSRQVRSYIVPSAPAFRLLPSAYLHAWGTRMPARLTLPSNQPTLRPFYRLSLRAEQLRRLSGIMLCCGSSG